MSTLMVKQAEDAKVSSKVTVEAVAVESLSDNSASRACGGEIRCHRCRITPNRPPVLWRLSVSIDRDGGQLKMSKVDFLQ